MSFLQRVAACNRFDLSHFIPFLIDGVSYGRVLPGFAARLRRWPDVFTVADDAVSLHPALDGYRRRSEAVAEVVSVLVEEGVIRGWRGEYYPVTLDFEQPAAFEIERAAVPHFGLRAWGVHVNGLVRRGDETLVWIGQRATDKQTFPGMLDHLAAGGQPVGIGLLDNVVKECGEEAGVPPQLARNARYVRKLHYCCETSTGLKPDTIFVFDLDLPESFVPRNTDGEMERFFLWTLDEVADVVANTERFKPNCNLVLIDLLLRHGKLSADGADTAALQAALYSDLACVGYGSQFSPKGQYRDTKNGTG